MALKDITLGKASSEKKKAPTAPTKQTMNFVRREKKVSSKRLLPIILLIVIAAGCFLKFGLMDQLDKKVSANSKLSRKQSELTAMTTRLSEYSELADQYGRYSYGWMSEEEINIVDRMDIIDLIESKIRSAAIVESYAIKDNALTLTIHGVSLERLSKIVEELEKSEIVESVSVNSATADDGTEAIISMSIVLTKGVAEE